MAVGGCVFMHTYWRQNIMFQFKRYFFRMRKYTRHTSGINKIIVMNCVADSDILLPLRLYKSNNTTKVHVLISEHIVMNNKNIYKTSGCNCFSRCEIAV